MSLTAPPDEGRRAVPSSRNGDNEPRVLGTRSRRALFAEGLLSSGSDVAVPFLPVYLVVLGATSAQVGLLAAAAGLAGFVALLPGAWIARRAPSRKWVVVLGGSGGGRLVLLALAAVPAVLAGHAAVAVVILLGGLRVLIQTLSHPAWMAVFADVVPRRLTGVYQARKSLGASLVAMALAPAAGWTIGRVGGVEGFQLVFIACALMGLAGAYGFSRIIESPRPAEAAQPPAYGKVLRDPVYRRYLLSMLALHGSATMAGPFVVVYMVEHVGASTAQIGLMSTGDALAAVTGLTLVSMLVARLSSRRLLVGALLVNAAVPVLWIGVAAPWQAAFPVLLSGLAWSVIHVAAFNLLLEQAPEERIPEYVAAQQFAVMGAGVVGPLLGSMIVAGWGMTVLFAISAAGRLLALGLFSVSVPQALAPVTALNNGVRRIAAMATSSFR